MNHKISIVLNGYNGSKYLKTQIDSILYQSYKNFELILYDDCSTDNTYQIFLDYQKKDNRIKVFRNKKNLGLINSCNLGLSKTTGDYITLADNDNKWKKDRLKIMMDYFKKYPYYDLIFHDSYVCNNQLKIIEKSFLKKIAGSVFSINYTNINDHSFKNLLNNNNHIPGTSILFKSTFLKYINPIPTTSMHDIWIGLIISAMGKIGYINKSLVYYRQHSNNLVGASVDNNAAIYKRLTNSTFIKDYINNKKNYLVMLNKLKTILKSQPKYTKTINQRIKVVKATLKLAKSQKTTLIIKNSLSLLKSIIVNKNYPHLKYALYIMVYKLIHRFD